MGQKLQTQATNIEKGYGKQKNEFLYSTKNMHLWTEKEKKRSDMRWSCYETAKDSVEDELFGNFETQLPTLTARIERTYVIKR